MSTRQWIEAPTSREMREIYLQQAFLPVAKAAFARDPAVQSLVLAISQYWDDEADDAVHLNLVPCPVRDPRWPDCLRDNPYVLVEQEEGDEEPFEMVNERGEALCGWEVMRAYPELDDNSTAIIAFASCCPEERSQEDPMSQAYQPYAIARRVDLGEPALEVVGRVLRPEWEDRFDAGFKRPVVPAVPVDLGVQVPPPGPLKRILRLIKGGG